MYYHAWSDLKSTIRIMAVATVPLTALEPSGVLVFWVSGHRQVLWVSGHRQGGAGVVGEWA